MFKLFHCDADEFIFNCGGLYQYLMSRPEFVLIEDIICLQEHESFVIENIIKLSKRNPLKQNREFQSIFVLGEKKPGALSEIDDDFNGNYGDILPSERVMISLRQGKPLGKNADVLDYKLRDVDDNFFEVFDSFHPTVNQYNANSDSSCHNTYSERVNLADIDDFDNSSDGTDGRGQTELLDYDGCPNESVLKGRTKLINFDELDAEVGPKGLAEIDDFDEFCEESILEEEYQTKPDCKSKTSSQSKKDKPKYALSKHYGKSLFTPSFPLSLPLFLCLSFSIPHSVLPSCKSKTSSQSKKDKPKYALSKHYGKSFSTSFLPLSLPRFLYLFLSFPHSVFFPSSLTCA